MIDKLRRMNAKMAFSEKERMKLYRVLAGYLKSDKTAVEAVEVVGRRHAARKTQLTYVFDDLSLSLASGKTLSAALQPWIPNNEYIFITSGERGGVLLSALEELEDLTIKMRDLKESTVQKLSGPSATFLVTLLVIIGFSTFVAPKLEESFDMEMVPAQTQLFFAFTHFVSATWWVWTLLLIGGLFGLVLSLPTWTGKVRSLVDNLPPWTLYRTRQSAQFLITTASMLKTDISVTDAIAVAGEEGSPWLANHADNMLQKIAEGDQTAKAIDVGMLPREFADEIIDFGETSSFEDALMYAGRQALEEVAVAFTKFATVFQGLSKFVIFAFVLALLMSVMGFVSSAISTIAI